MSFRYASLSDLPPHLQRINSPVKGAEPKSPAKRPKYGNQPTIIDGIRFASRLEARCYQWLMLRWKAGDLLWFVRQVNFDLPGGVKYRADFVVVCKDGVEVIDAKGMLTPDCKNKLKQMKAVHGIDVQLWTGAA